MDEHMTPREEAARFLRDLFCPYDAGYIELRAWRVEGKQKSPIQEFFPVADYERAADCAIRRSDAGEDVYFGVLPRDTTRNGKKENVSRAAWFWLDVDFKTTPQADAEAAMADDAPDVVVHSGGGLHCYWRLTNVLDLDAATKRRFEASVARKIRSVGGDPSAKDASRVLRVPGTNNYKYTPYRAVRLMPGLGYGKPDLPELTPAMEQALWELELAFSETKCAQEYARMMVWLWGARAAGNTKAEKQWQAKTLAWRREQARKRDGLRITCPFLNTEVIVVERIPYIPPGEPVIFEREELEMLNGYGEDAVRAAWEAKRAFGGKWTGRSRPPAADAYFAEVSHAG